MSFQNGTLSSMSSHFECYFTCVSFKGIACSNDTAKYFHKWNLHQEEPSMSNIKPIVGDDHHIIAELLSISPLEVPVAAFSTKRCFE